MANQQLVVLSRFSKAAHLQQQISSLPPYLYAESAQPQLHRAAQARLGAVGLEGEDGGVVADGIDSAAHGKVQARMLKYS